MKTHKNNFPLGFAAWLVQELSIFNFQLIVILFIFASCNFQHSENINNDDSNDYMKNAPSFVSPIDSLEWVINNEELPAKMRIEACDILSYELIYSDVNKSHSHALKGLEMIEKTKIDSLTGALLCTLGMVYDLKGKHDSAKIYLQKALLHSIENENDNLISFIYLALGLVYSNTSQYEQSVDYYEKALYICENKGYKRRYSTIINNIAITYLKLQNYERAEHYLLKSKEIYLENPYPDGLAHVYLNLGIMYYEQNRLKEAREVSDECLKIFQSTGNTSGEALAYINQSRLLSCEKKFNEAMEAAHKSLKLANESGYIYVIKNAYLELSHLYSEIGNNKLCEEYALKELEHIDSSETTELWLFYKKLHKIYIKEGKKEEAINTFAKYDSLSNVVNTTQVQTNYNELNIKYETEKKERDIEQQQYIISRQQMRYTLLLSGAAISIVILVLLWYMLRIRIQKNKALIEMNDTKDKFFSIISHDLKNPAISQRDAIKLLVDNVKLWDTATLTEYYNELLKSAEEEVELIYNLLGWAQVQTGRITCKPEKILLSDILHNLSIIRKTAEKKGINFTITTPENVTITADSNILATTIRNLLTNAVKFTNQGGQVSLSIENVEDGKFKFTVSDDGTGMSKEQMQNLFRLDFTHSNQGTAGEQGSGLGLIVCRDLLVKHGSVLNVESEEGKGSRFWFYIDTFLHN